MPIKLIEDENIYIKNKKIKIWDFLKVLYFILSFMSTIILSVIIITIIILLNNYWIGCDGIKDDVIVCNITKWKNMVDEPNYIINFVNKYCPYLWN